MRSLSDHDLPLDLVPDPSDLDGAVANVNVLLAAAAAGSIDPYEAGAKICGQLVRHMPADEPWAVDLYVMWAELTDIVELCNSSRDAEALSLLREAAREWRPGFDVHERSEYFKRWEAARSAWSTG